MAQLQSRTKVNWVEMEEVLAAGNGRTCLGIFGLWPFLIFTALDHMQPSI
jgi:hypothetical protein